MTTQRLTQAYRQTPWRTQLQWIGLFLLALIILATVAGVYLSVSAGAAAVGREIQQLEYDREMIAREIADKRTLLAQLTSTSQMSKRATELGYESIQAGSVQYMVIPGYIPRQPASLVTSSAYSAYQPSLVEPRFTQSLLEWITEQFITLSGQLSHDRAQLSPIVTKSSASSSWSSALVIIFQMFRLQTSASAKELLEASERYAGVSKLVYPDRGNIYDRWGHLLAGDQQVYEVGINLQASGNRDPETLATVLQAVLGVDYATVLEAAKMPYVEGKSEYVVITDFVSAEKINALAELKQRYAGPAESRRADQCQA